MAENISVEVDGDSFRKTVHALELFAPDLRAELLKDIRSITKEVRSDAAGRLPVRTGTGRAGFKSSIRMRGDDLRGVVFNKTPQSQILEFAGSKSSGATPQGQSLISTLNSRYGSTGRFMWDAYDRASVPQRINAAVADAERKLKGGLERADA